MIHPSTELQFISPDIGYGVVATEFIPRGTITWVQDALDREFTPEEMWKLDPIYRKILDTYTFRNKEGNYVLCWDHARFVNHSFNANCMTTAYDFEIAIRDIHPGEQLTDDYGYLNIETPFRACPEGTKRKVVYPDDLVRYHKVWDKKLQSAFRHIRKYHQPLIELLSTSLMEKIDNILRGEEEMDSILTCYYAGNGTEEMAR
jgi:hypothetical protein